MWPAPGTSTNAGVRQRVGDDPAVARRGQHVALSDQDQRRDRSSAGPAFRCGRGPRRSAGTTPSSPATSAPASATWRPVRPRTHRAGRRRTGSSAGRNRSRRHGSARRGGSAAPPWERAASPFAGMTANAAGRPSVTCAMPPLLVPTSPTATIVAPEEFGMLLGERHDRHAAHAVADEHHRTLRHPLRQDGGKVGAELLDRVAGGVTGLPRRRGRAGRRARSAAHRAVGRGTGRAPAPPSIRR